MNIASLTSKQVGALGEKVAGEYLRRQGMKIVATNVARKTGELDIIAKKESTLYFVEVKSIMCDELPVEDSRRDEYDPSANLHEAKIRKAFL